MSLATRIVTAGIASAMALTVLPTLAASADAAAGSASSAAARTLEAGLSATAIAATAPAGDYDDFSGNRKYAKYFTQKVVWSPRTCPAGGDPLLAAYLECAKITVPRDWYHVAAGSITLGLSRMGGTLAQPRRARLLLSNPGGPGGVGLEFGLISTLFLGLTKTHTGIGIDPRGVGLSTNLVCPDQGQSAANYHSDGDSLTFSAAGIAADARDNANYIAACRKARATLLPFINSDQTARDFNLVRALMGYKTFDYYGVSYGTWLGAVLEKMFPNRAARLVLDGNTDWASGSFDTVFDSQPMSFQAAYDRVFLPWLGRHNATYGLGTSAVLVNQSIEWIRNQAGAHVFGSAVTPDLLDGYLAQTQYSTMGWDEAGNTLKGLVQVISGNRSHLAALVATLEAAQTSDPAGNSVFTAVRCNDVAGSRNTATFAKAAIARAGVYPLIGGDELNSACATWPYGPALSAALLSRPVRGVLMLQTEADPATGYDGALHSRLKSVGQVRMVTVGNAPGHGAGLLSSDCAAAAATAYLTKGTYPRNDLYCKSTPITSGAISDTRVYEFFHQGSAKVPLPAAYAYPRRDLSEPAIDPSVAAGSAAASVSSVSSVSSGSGVTGLEAWLPRAVNPWRSPSPGRWSRLTGSPASLPLALLDEPLVLCNL